MTRHVLIALPAYDGTTRAETTGCLLKAQKECAARGWDFTYKVAVGDSILPRARNRFIAEALADRSITDVFFLDHDIAWGDGAFMRMMDHDVDCVAGVYPKREDPITFPVRYIDNMEILLMPNGLIEVEGVPAGFFRVTARMLRLMVDHYYHLQYEDTTASTGQAWSLFDFQLVGGKYWGEDMVFCRRWRAMGGKVWVDPSLHFSHIGPKGFQGCLADHLNKTTAEAEKAEKVA